VLKGAKMGVLLQVVKRKSIQQEEGEIPAEKVSGDDLASRRLY
jgi:hypothetical protein